MVPGRSYDTLITYGPWVDRQRLLFMQNFFGSAHADVCVQKPVLGAVPIADAFKLRVTCFHFATVRLPYTSVPNTASFLQSLAPQNVPRARGNGLGAGDSAVHGGPGRYESARTTAGDIWGINGVRAGPGAAHCAWISAAFDAGSEIRARIPTIVRSMSGCTGNVLCDLVRPTFVSSVTHAPIISAESVSVPVKIPQSTLPTTYAMQHSRILDSHSRVLLCNFITGTYRCVTQLHGTRVSSGHSMSLLTLLMYFFSVNARSATACHVSDVPMLSRFRLLMFVHAIYFPNVL